MFLLLANACITAALHLYCIVKHW